MFNANRRCEQCSKPLLLHDRRGLYDPIYWSFWPSILESPSTNQYHGREHCSYVHKLTQECMCTMGRTARSSRWTMSDCTQVSSVFFHLSTSEMLSCYREYFGDTEILKLNEVSTIPQPHSASKLALVNILCHPSCHSMPFPIQYHWLPLKSHLVRWNPWLESPLRVGWCSFSSRRSGDWHFYGQRLSILNASQDSIHRFLGFPLRPSNADLGVSQLSVFWWQSWVQILCWQIFLILFVSFCLSNPPVSLSLFLLVWAEISISRVGNCGKKTTVLFYTVLLFKVAPNQDTSQTPAIWRNVLQCLPQVEPPKQLDDSAGKGCCGAVWQEISIMARRVVRMCIAWRQHTRFHSVYPLVN